MALTFYWRAEAGTLDGTDDFSAGDTSATANNSPEFSATAAKYGTNGMLFDAVSERYDFNPASIVSPGEGAVGGWFQFPTSFPSTAAANLFFCRGAAANDYVIVTTLGAASDRRLRFDIRNATGGAATLSLATAQLLAANWYFYLARWNSSIDYRSIAVYDTSGTLIEEVVDSATDFSANVPADLTNVTGLRYGDTTGTTGTLYADNVFIAGTYDEPIENNMTITSYTAYDAGAGDVLHAQACF